MFLDNLISSTQISTLKERETGSSNSTFGSTQLLITTTTPYIGTPLKLCKLTSQALAFLFSKSSLYGNLRQLNLI